jgi:hypothetical protein
VIACERQPATKPDGKPERYPVRLSKTIPQREGDPKVLWLNLSWEEAADAHRALGVLLASRPLPGPGRGVNKPPAGS